MYSAADHTFVICAYQENSYLETTIISLLRQSVRSTLLLSTSTPNESIREVCAKYQIRMVVNQKPNLAGDDWNYAYSQAMTPLVTLVHQDDYYDMCFLQNTLKAANDVKKDFLLLFTNYYEIRDGQEVRNNSLLIIKSIMNTPLRFDALSGSVFLKKRILAFGNSICCPSVTYNKALLGENIFDTTFKNSCDYKTFVDLAKMPGCFVYIPEKLMGHRIYADSATSRNISENIRRKEDLSILKELWPTPIARTVSCLYARSEKSNSLI